MVDYLSHHGIEGQKWGVRNGPPYPLESSRITLKNGDAKSANDIYNTLTTEEKRLITARQNPPDFYTTQEEREMYLAVSTVLKYGKTPMSIVDAWKDEGNSVQIALMTRNTPAARCKGYAYKAAKSTISKLKRQTNIKEAYWDVRSDNEGSKKIANKLGFEYIDSKSKPNVSGTWELYRKEIK